MPAETDIVNVALRKIGGTAITALDDGSTNANIAQDLYDEIRDSLLRSHPWNFATKRASLAKLTTAPTFEFDNAFAMPADWLRTVSVHDNDAGLGALWHRAEVVADTRVILANAEQVYMRYVYQVTDPNLMTADFRMTLEAALARDLALPVASSNTLYQAFDDQLRIVLSKAKSVDAQGSSPEARPRGSWADSRGGWPSSRWPT